MKNITLIVHNDIEQALADTLRSVPHANKFIFTRVEGHSVHDERDISLSARDKVVGYTAHVRVDILVEDAEVSDLLQVLRGADCGLAGRGYYWVTEAQAFGEL